MLILGIGLISARGLGITAWEDALRHGWQPPAQVEARRTVGSSRSAYLVDLEALPDKTLLRKLRRADKLSKMAVLAAADALADSGIEADARGKVGIILATALGPHVTTFEFLDGILDYGDAAASPTAFSHSVHNAAASYIASSLAIQGPTLTVTQFSFPFQAALQLARCWLDQGRCDQVLVGAADQYGEVLGYVAGEKLGAAAEGRIRPFTFTEGRPVPGEGAVFCLLGRERTGQAYCRIAAVHTGSEPDPAGPADLHLVEADGLLPDESCYLRDLAPGIPLAAYSPLVGSMLTGGAFSVAAGALMLKRQVLYATPVPENPHRLRVLDRTRPGPVGTIRSIGCNCQGERAVTLLAAL